MCLTVIINVQGSTQTSVFERAVLLYIVTKRKWYLVYFFMKRLMTISLVSNSLLPVVRMVSLRIEARREVCDDVDCPCIWWVHVIMFIYLYAFYGRVCIYMYLKYIRKYMKMILKIFQLNAKVVKAWYLINCKYHWHIYEIYIFLAGTRLTDNDG